MKKGVERTAGYIVDYLKWAEEAKIHDIVEEIDMPQPVVLMGIGFLVSEDRVETVNEEGNVISLQG